MTILTIAHVAVSIMLIALIAIQEQSGDAPGLFGGAGGGGFYQKRRGLEKMVFGATIALTALFIALAALNLVVPSFSGIR
jgi:protein translocase SecG subunit